MTSQRIKDRKKPVRSGALVCASGHFRIIVWAGLPLRGDLASSPPLLWHSLAQVLRKSCGAMCCNPTLSQQPRRVHDFFILQSQSKSTSRSTILPHPRNADVNSHITKGTAFACGRRHRICRGPDPEHGYPERLQFFQRLITCGLPGRGTNIGLCVSYQQRVRERQSASRFTLCGGEFAFERGGTSLGAVRLRC